ncbi:MAG: hypothetical protein ACMUIG_04680 [Thermoplasmatota archaeon]
MGKEHSDTYIIRSGSYLNTYCPHCEEGLNEDLHVTFSIINTYGEEGTLKLSPYLNVFTKESTVRLPEDVNLRDVLCPKCKKSLILDERRCTKCDSRVAKIHIEAMHHKLDFFFCSKRGCRWHGLDYENITDIVLEDSNEW